MTTRAIRGIIQPYHPNRHLSTLKTWVASPCFPHVSILFSFIATCQRHRVEPFAYLHDVLTRIASHPHNRLPDLMPTHWRPTS